MFAASLPFPIVPALPGLSAAHSPVSAAVLHGVVAQSWGAHVRNHYGTPARCENTTKSNPVNLELVALLRSMVLEVLAPPPVAELLPVHQPACAGGQWCVKGEDLVRFTGSELSCSDFVMAALGWAGHPVRVPWRHVQSWKTLGKLEGGVWLTLQELKAVARFVRGWSGERLRRALAGEVEGVAA